jgi:hypothetical protein
MPSLIRCRLPRRARRAAQNGTLTSVKELVGFLNESKLPDPAVVGAHARSTFHVMFSSCAWPFS